MKLGKYLTQLSQSGLIAPLGRSDASMGPLPREALGRSEAAWGEAPDPGLMPLAEGIFSTAQALGMDPADLATIISYETGGTFDPTKAGPTTQWGQHRGLIQFGEQQAREYGVDWNDPVGSQLGPDGAIAKYFRRNGWRPGMGLLDAYSIVNAGSPGRYNASDASNGGAPGTVADKVRDQMGGHRENAMRLFGGAMGGGQSAPGGQSGFGGQSAPPSDYRAPAWEPYEFGDDRDGYAPGRGRMPRDDPYAPSAQAPGMPPLPQLSSGLDPEMFMRRQPANALATYAFGPGQNPYEIF